MSVFETGRCKKFEKDLHASFPSKQGSIMNPGTQNVINFPLRPEKNGCTSELSLRLCTIFYICVSGNPKVEPHHLNQLIIAVFSRSAIYSYICRYYNQAWG